MTTLLLALASPTAAQPGNFSVEAYKSFLDANAQIGYADLEQMHPAGLFQETAPTRFGPARYSDSVATKYDLTGDERALINRHGFMVTERLQPNSFGDAFMDIYKKDLPVFVSTDAILHALHMSYDRILMDTERAVLIPKLETLLTRLRAALPALADRYAGSARMATSINDLDVYLTVPLALLKEGAVEPVFSENQETVQQMLELVEAEQGGVRHPLFSETCRLLDFSQFTPRGHYTRSEALTRYFQAMMWLGRTELYLIGPKTNVCKPTDADVQRQTIDTALMVGLADQSETNALLQEIDRLIQLFAGEQDNATLENVRSLLEAADVEQASDLLEEDRWRDVQDALRETGQGFQRINSQILMGGPMAPDSSLEPASAFMLLGQRFVIDSYITGEVVHEKVRFRMMPSTQDVLFALGNDAAKQFLQADLEKYDYAPRLAALRYLIDGYGSDFWNSTIYNGWLQAIRTLNPPAKAERGNLPPFMQTAAWWQEKMNTQLAGWAQLRHDNLLYAKQSYTGGIVCMYPYSYVEPIPAFYEAVSGLATRAADRFAALDGGTGNWQKEAITNHFRFMSAVSDTLGGIAQKELSGTPLSENERHFLKHMIREEHICGRTIDGWYPKLFYNDPERSRKNDLVVADVHTTPTDRGGSMVGWVLHAGTGPVNMAVVTAALPEAGEVAFIGPVMSYYQHRSTNFERLTDEQWKTAYAAEPSFRPDFVNLYLANQQGAMRRTVSSPVLATGVEEAPAEPKAPSAAQLVQNRPNPFSEATTIGFTVPREQAHQPVRLVIYDVQGRRIRQLVSQPLPDGHYTVEWDGTTRAGTPVASGVYVARLQIGNVQATRTITRVR